MAEKYDFSKMKYPLPPHDKTVLETHTELCKYKEFNQDGVNNIDKLIRYVMFAYDRNSPFHKVAAGDTLKRKKLALEYAGIKKELITSEEYIDEIINLQNVVVNMIAVRYIRLQGDVKFSLLMSRYDNFHQSMFLIMSNQASMDGDKIKSAAAKTNFAATLDAEATMIQKLAAEVFFEEPELIVEADEMIQAENEFVGIVEKFALPARQ